MRLSIYLLLRFSCSMFALIVHWCTLDLEYKSAIATVMRVFSVHNNFAVIRIPTVIFMLLLNRLLVSGAWVDCKKLLVLLLK